MSPGFFILLVPFLILPVAYAQQIESPGFMTRLDIATDHGVYEVSVVTNLDLTDFEFDADGNRLTLFVTNQLEDSLAEITIPQDLFGEEITFHLNGQEFFPTVRSSGQVLFVVMNFTGTGDNEIAIIGAGPAEAMPDIVGEVTAEGTSADAESEPDGGGCLIATAAFGSEMSYQVQQLREVRDRVIRTESGRAFMDAFNGAYYMFSPAVADYERHNPAFKEAVKVSIAPMIYASSILNHVGLDSEGEVLVYGAGVLLLVAGLHVAPVVAFVHLWRTRRLRPKILFRVVFHGFLSFVGSDPKQSINSSSSAAYLAARTRSCGQNCIS